VQDMVSAREESDREMSRSDKKRVSRKHYAKPISLYPLSFTEAVADLLKTPPPLKRLRGRQQPQRREQADNSK